MALITGLNWNRQGFTALSSCRRQHNLPSPLSKWAGFSNGDHALSAEAAIAEVQGTSAINDLLAEIGRNPEFAGATAKATASAELCLA